MTLRLSLRDTDAATGAPAGPPRSVLLDVTDDTSVAEVAESHTGTFLAPILDGRGARQPGAPRRQAAVAAKSAPTTRTTKKAPARKAPATKAAATKATTKATARKTAAKKSS